MSIRDEINTLVHRRGLFPLLPVIPGDAVERTMFVSAQIQSSLEGPWEIECEAKRFGKLRADLESFVKGEIITVCMTPFEHKTAYMGRLAGDEVWDVRSRDPHPGIRVFGRFAMKDVFIAMTWAYRPRLRDRNSDEWKWEIANCQREWRKLFGAFVPIQGTKPDEYISNFILV